MLPQDPDNSVREEERGGNNVDEEHMPVQMRLVEELLQPVEEHDRKNDHARHECQQEHQNLLRLHSVLPLATVDCSIAAGRLTTRAGAPAGLVSAKARRSTSRHTRPVPVTLSHRRFVEEL